MTIEEDYKLILSRAEYWLNEHEKLQKRYDALYTQFFKLANKSANPPVVIATDKGHYTAGWRNGKRDIIKSIIEEALKKNYINREDLEKIIETEE